MHMLDLAQQGSLVLKARHCLLGFPEHDVMGWSVTPLGLGFVAEDTCKPIELSCKFQF